MAKHFSRIFLTKAVVLLPILGIASSVDSLMTQQLLGNGVVSQSIEVPDSKSWGNTFQEDPTGKQG